MMSSSSPIHHTYFNEEIKDAKITMENAVKSMKNKKVNDLKGLPAAADLLEIGFRKLIENLKKLFTLISLISYNSSTSQKIVSFDIIVQIFPE